MKKEFTRKGAIELSNERRGNFPTDLSVPAIPCQEAKDMWIFFKDNRDAQGEKLIFLLGHLADTLGEHQQGCPALSENALDEVRQTMWKEI